MQPRSPTAADPRDADPAEASSLRFASAARTLGQVARQRGLAVPGFRSPPRLDGVEAARHILAARPVPIVLLTAYGYGELISRALEVGVAGFVVKPFKEQALIEALHAADGTAPDAVGLAALVRQRQQTV